MLFLVKPEMSTALSLSRAAAAAGGRGSIPCRATAAPRPHFTWARDGQPLSINSTSKYVVEFKQVIINILQYLLIMR